MAEQNNRKTFGAFNFRSVRDMELGGNDSAEDGNEQPPDAEPTPAHTSPADIPQDHNSASETDREDPAVRPQSGPAAEEQQHPADIEDELPSNPEPRADNDPVSHRLQALRESASEVRRQLAETRKQLSKQRAMNIALQDQIAKLQEDLRSAQAEKDFSNNQLLEMQERLANAIAEDENRNARLLQLQEHYERIQVENQAQFEELDRLRAEAMRNEQNFQKELAAVTERLNAKNSILVQTLRLIADDPDIEECNLPDEILGDRDAGRLADLQQQIQQLRQQVEYEQDRTEQLEAMLRVGGESVPSKFVIGILTAILIGIITMILLIFLRTPAAPPTPEYQDSNSANSDFSGSISVPQPEPQENSDEPDAGGLDLPPDNGSSLNSRTTGTTWPDINLPGARITHNSKAMRIVFNYGLFSQKTVMTPKAKADLAKLAARIGKNITDYTLIIEGHADPLPVTTGKDEHADNYALGMARAAAVKDYLEQKCNVPPGIIKTASAGDSEPPFPNTTPESRLKNRTAVIFLVPRAKG